MRGLFSRLSQKFAHVFRRLNENAAAGEQPRLPALMFSSGSRIKDSTLPAMTAGMKKLYGLTDLRVDGTHIAAFP
jgi:hypothetical protein